MTLRHCVVFGLLIGLCACGDGATAPQGTYHLIALKEQPLPYDDPLGCCVYTGGTLVLEAGNYEIAITFRNKNSSIVSTFREQGSYHLTGTDVEFQPTGGDAPMHLYNARLEGDVIRLAMGGDGPGAADQYSAVFRK